MMRNPPKKPISGEVTMGMMTLCRTPSITTLPSFTFSTDQRMASRWLPEAARVAPQMPPTSAWVELEGRPNHQVMRFQTIPPRRAQTMTIGETNCESTRPEETVFATACPARAPIRFVTPARMMA